MTLDRDAAATDALLTDLYLDALLAGAVLDAATSLGTRTDAAGALDPAARRAADRLRHDLVRVHPSFRFEERLATRLAEAAVAMRVQVAGGGGRVVSFRTGPPAPIDAALFANAGGPGAMETEAPAGDVSGFDASTGSSGGIPGLVPPRRTVPGRPLLIGGALTSAALSLAGAAFVAWRIGRPGRAAGPMARAARAVREARLSAALDAIGPGGRSAPRRLD